MKLKDLNIPKREIARELARRFSTMSHEELDVLDSILIPMKFKKGEKILAEGAICEHIYYLHQGLVRQYYYKNGKEMTSHLGIDGKIVQIFLLKMVYNYQLNILIYE